MNFRRLLRSFSAGMLAFRLLTPSPAAEPAAPTAAPTAIETGQLRTLLSRLQGAGNGVNQPVPVAVAIRSLFSPVSKTFSGPPGSGYSRVTITVRTRHAHWNPALMTGGQGDAAGTVGWYTWQWNVRRTASPATGEITIMADNALMLDPAYVARNEGDALGQAANESLLYHELLHGQLLLNAMDDPAWQAALCATGTFDASARDAGHAVIGGLERAYLLRRAGHDGFSVAAGSAVPADGAFTILLGGAPAGYRGGYTMNYWKASDSNVTGLRMEAPRHGPNRGQILLRGVLVDPCRDGYFLARITPLPQTPAERGVH